MSVTTIIVTGDEHLTHISPAGFLKKLTNQHILHKPVPDTNIVPTLIQQLKNYPRED